MTPDVATPPACALWKWRRPVSGGEQANGCARPSNGIVRFLINGFVLAAGTVASPVARNSLDW